MDGLPGVPGWARDYHDTWEAIVGATPALALTRIRVATTRTSVAFGGVMLVVYLVLLLSHEIERLAEASIALVIGSVTLCLVTYYRQWQVGARIVGALDSSGVPTAGVPRFHERDFVLWCELQGVTSQQVRTAGSLTR